MTIDYYITADTELPPYILKLVLTKLRNGAMLISHHM